MKRTECFHANNSRNNSSRLNLNSSTRIGMDSFTSGRESPNASRTREMNHLFKIPSFQSVPSRRTTMKNVSPKRIAPVSKPKNELKISQQSKMNFRPSASFINASRKSFHSNARNNQSRKELIKKMVYLAECAMKNNEEIKHSTPVASVPTFTPRARRYLVLPEFTKKAPNIHEIRTPLKEFVRRETMVSKSTKLTPLVVQKNNKSIIKEQEISNESFFCEVTGAKHTETNNVSLITCNQSEAHDIRTSLLVNSTENIKEILEHFQSYNGEMNKLIEKLQIEEDYFENAVKELPQHAIYDEFCLCQARKQELYDKIKALDDELSLALKKEVDVTDKLNHYIRENRSLFNKHIKLHKEFESIIKTKALKSVAEEKSEVIPEKNTVSVEENRPKLRRSLRLSKVPKKEATPMQKRLSRLNTMSKGIQKTKKSPCAKKGRHLRL